MFLYRKESIITSKPMCLKKVSLAVTIITLLWGCGEEKKDFNALPRQLEGYFMKKDTVKPFIVNVINPYECYICQSTTQQHLAFYPLNNNFIPVANAIFILPKIRQIEQKKFLNESKLTNNGYTVIFSDTIVNELRNTIQQKFFASFVVLYGNDQKKIFAREISTNGFSEELISYFLPNDTK